MFLLIRKSDRDQKRDRISLNSIMFLLIPQCKLCTVRAVLALNSIMFLLIQLTGTQKRIQKINFKFHYVSINSKLKSILTGEQAALNSIMFLLIHEPLVFCNFAYLPLNSIMFLLIRCTVECFTHLLPGFKFHYVSINSPSQNQLLIYSTKHLYSVDLFKIYHFFLTLHHMFQ